MFWPRLKNVAGPRYDPRVDMMPAVLGPGPSSKVSATVLPLPGAPLRAPYGAAGQPVEMTGAVTCGGDATRPLGSSAGGPAGPSLPGGGGVAAMAGTAPNAPVTPRAIAAASRRGRKRNTIPSQLALAATSAAGARRTSKVELVSPPSTRARRARPPRTLVLRRWDLCPVPLSPARRPLLP